MRLTPAGIVEEWHALVPLDGALMLTLLDTVERVVMRAAVPGMTVSEITLWRFRLVPRPGTRGLAIRHVRLTEWTACVTVAASGAYVGLSWYLVARASWWGDFRRLVRPRSTRDERRTIGSDLSVARRALLGHLVSLTRHAVDVAASGDDGRTRASER